VLLDDAFVEDDVAVIDAVDAAALSTNAISCSMDDKRDLIDRRDDTNADWSTESRHQHRHGE